MSGVGAKSPRNSSTFAATSILRGRSIPRGQPINGVILVPLLDSSTLSLLHAVEGYDYLMFSGFPFPFCIVSGTAYTV